MKAAMNWVAIHGLTLGKFEKPGAKSDGDTIHEIKKSAPR